MQTITAVATAIDGVGNTSSSTPLLVDVVDPTGAFDPVFGINGSLLPDEEILGSYPPFDDRTKVYITLPGGKREAYSFKPKMVEETADGSLGIFAKYFYDPVFESEKGSTNKLTLEYNGYVRQLENGRFTNPIGSSPFNPADGYYGGVYVLTTKDGTKYRIDAATGDLLTVKDTNGNTLTYSDDAIVSSTGEQITFERDANGRIVSVKDPAGSLVTYGYDANGDLLSVSDRENNTTRMVYDTSYDDPNYVGTQDVGRVKRSHYLREIIDPLGRVGARTEYDETGRLKQIVNVNGQAVDMGYDLANDRQIVKDQLGNETVYVYDDRGNVLTEIDAIGKITKRSYDENNNVLEETVISDRSGPTGYKTKYTYDKQNNQLTQTNALGETIYSTYGANSRLLTETDSIGRTTTNRYDDRGNLTETIDASGKSSGYTYAASGLLRSVRDAAGKETSLGYDQRGNVFQVTDASGNATNYTYNRRGDKLSETRSRTKVDGTIETLVSRWTYDNEGRMTSTTDPLGRVSTYEYDKLGRQISMTDALGRSSRSVYNEKGELVESIAPDSTPNDLSDNPRMRMVYDAAGRKISEIDVLGRETRYVYDKVGRLVETILPDMTVSDWSDNGRSKTEYYSDGLVKAQIDLRGNRTEFRYDALGRQIAVIAADLTPNDVSDNPTTRYVYDKAGQQSSVTDALGRSTKYVYDNLGRMVKTVFADESFTSQEYDTLGRRVGAIDQNGKRTEYRYDDLGRLTGVKNAIGDWTSYGYNAQGQLMSMADAEGRITRYEYDSLGRRADTYLPLNQRSSQTYDEVGNLKTSTDFNGKTITYGYDAQNRLIEKSFADGTKVTYSYTFNGLQDKVTFLSAIGTVTAIYDYDYDVRDRLIKRTDTIDGVARAIEYGYDIGSNRTSVTTASGTTTYTYDERNRLDLVKQNGVLAADYDYDAISNLNQTTFGNGTRENRSYDTLNRLTTLETKRLGDNTPLSKYVYTLDKVGNRKSVTETQNGQGRSIAYTYDDLYRLTKESIVDSVNSDRSSSYVYDKVGNRLGKTVNGVTTAYVYDGNDRLLNEKVNGTAIVTYGYDGNGSTIAKTENGQTSTYVWNDDKRLVSATVNGKAISYTYNDQGIRVSSTVDGVETRYLLDEGITANVWEEYSPNGTVQASYVYGYDLISQVRSGVSSFYLVDGLGSTRLLTDTQGQVLNAYGYEAFGETVSQSGTATNAYQYAGEQFDGAIGDYYLRQRFYDPSSGRFGRMDTFEAGISNPSRSHKYTYAWNNPVIWTDPSGFYSNITEILQVLNLAAIITNTSQALYNSYRALTAPTEEEARSATIQAGFNTLGVFLGISGGGFLGGGGSLALSSGSAQVVPAVVSRGEIIAGVAIPVAQSIFSITSGIGAGGFSNNIGVNDEHVNKSKHCLADLAPTWIEQRQLLVDAVSQIVSSSSFPGNVNTQGKFNGRTVYNATTQIQNSQGSLITTEIRFRQNPGGSYEIGTAFVPKDFCSSP